MPSQKGTMLQNLAPIVDPGGDADLTKVIIQLNQVIAILQNNINRMVSSELILRLNANFLCGSTYPGVVHVMDQQSNAVANTTNQSPFNNLDSTTEYTIAANTFKKEMVLRVYAAGKRSSTGTPTLRFRIRLTGSGGTKTILGTGNVTVGSGSSGGPYGWEVEFVGTIRETGSGNAGRLQTSGRVMMDNAVNGNFATRQNLLVLLDTTIEQTVGVTATWGTASASNTTTMENFTVSLYEVTS